MAYMTGFNNYETVAEARRAFWRCTCWVALKEFEGGGASITWLQAEPVQAGQTEYVLANATKVSGGPK